MIKNELKPVVIGTTTKTELRVKVKTLQSRMEESNYNIKVLENANKAAK